MTIDNEHNEYVGDCAGFNLFTLDALPSKCSIEAQISMSATGLIARFRVSRPRRWKWLRGIERSEWSGWFEYDDEPIVLSWAVFWP